MFYGTKISEAKPFKSQKLFESGEFATYHLSAAILESKEQGKVKVLAKTGKDQEVTVAILSKESETARLDLYINCTQQIQLLVKGSGKSEVSLSGYFEPKADDMDDDMFYGQEGAEEDDDDLDDISDDDEDPQEKKGKKETAKVNENLKQAKANSSKNKAMPT